MTDFKWGAFGTPGTAVTLTADITTAADDSRRVFDYSNSTGKHLLAHLLVEGIQYGATTGIVNGTAVMEVYVLPGDGAGSEGFPGGGGRNADDSADVGNNLDPQPLWLAAVLTSIAPSTTVDEPGLGCIIPIFPGTNRIILKNVSGQTMTGAADNINVELTTLSYAF
jgi:hypothetical protein